MLPMRALAIVMPIAGITVFFGLFVNHEAAPPSRTMQTDVAPCDFSLLHEGDSAALVRELCGLPDFINTYPTVGKKLRHQWSYFDGGYASVYFGDDGVVTHVDRGENLPAIVEYKK